ncbi:hypothetical protein JCM33374_g6661 [Metschnikowia sp. JCM 33374]|nr:hypothetical protein JCM33374_g6661 [Metschnikowia sp. JCM 33374]
MKLILFATVLYSFVAADSVVYWRGDNEITAKIGGPLENRGQDHFHNTNSPALTFSINKLVDGTLKVTTLKPEDHLQIFFARLKSFVNDAGFDFERFAEDLDDLGVDLSQIGAMTQSSTRSEFGVFDKFVYVNRMFQVMVKTSETMVLYDVPDKEGHLLLYKIIELKVRIYALCNIRGDLDLTIEGYAEKVRCLLRSTYYWGMYFRTLPDVSLSHKMVFEDEITRVEKKLEALVKCIPKSWQGPGRAFL